MSEVKRYDPFGYDGLSALMHEDAHGDWVRGEDYDALAAENARLRVKLMTIASAEPARHGIEWAKAHAAEGNSEPYAKWREAIEERDALRQQRGKLAGLLLGLKVSVRDRAAGRAILADDVYELIDAALAELTP